MSHALAGWPSVIHALPGRVRLRLTAGTAEDHAAIADRIRLTHGIRQVDMNPHTESLLILFDPTVVDGPQVLALVTRLCLMPDHHSHPGTPGTIKGASIPSQVAPCRCSCHAGGACSVADVPSSSPLGDIVVKGAHLLLSLLLGEGPLALLVSALEVLGAVTRLLAIQGSVPLASPVALSPRIAVA